VKEPTLQPTTQKKGGKKFINRLTSSRGSAVNGGEKRLGGTELLGSVGEEGSRHGAHFGVISFKGKHWRAGLESSGKL